MLSQPRLEFLQKRVMDIQQALFFNESQSVLRFPISIINALQVDDAGQLWFIVRRPGQELNEFDKEFRAKLDFYKKGKEYYLHVRGKAFIVTDPEEINNVTGLSDNVKQAAHSSMVLIRMTLEQIEYYPANKQTSKLKPVLPKINLHPSGLVKSLQYIIKDIIPVFQSH